MAANPTPTDGAAFRDSKIAIALYDYTPEEPNELLLQVNDRIEILVQNDDIWLTVVDPNNQKITAVRVEIQEQERLGFLQHNM
jgi:hypothetical protein